MVKILKTLLFYVGYASFLFVGTTLALGAYILGVEQ
jgi:hypothetical protein